MKVKGETVDAKSSDGTGASGSSSCDAERDCRQDIEVAAYFLAEKRGFSPGAELDDWLAAEKSVAERVSVNIG